MQTDWLWTLHDALVTLLLCGLPLTAFTLALLAFWQGAVSAVALPLCGGWLGVLGYALHVDVCGY